MYKFKKISLFIVLNDEYDEIIIMNILIDESNKISILIGLNEIE